MSKLTYEDLQLPHFRNSRVVGSVGGTPITLLDAINAALLTKNNVFVAGKKGVGKTQLLFDMYNSRFGGKGVIVEGRPDLKADELYKQVNLRKMGRIVRGEEDAATHDEIIELARSVSYRFFGADELNRCPEITQNELLSIMNGYVLFKGKPVQLGDGFCVGLATGNLGNGEYVGTFRLDAALADRLHLFLDLDYYKPTDEDMAVIDARTVIDPRVKLSEPRDISDRLMTVSQEIASQETPFELVIVGRYLERALDYCMKYPSAGNSKDNLKEAWPVASCVQTSCSLKDTLCGRVKSVGERTVQAAKNLAKGLQYVAQLKNEKTAEDHIGAALTAVKLMLPYAGVISQPYLRETGNFNNPNIAASQLVEAMRTEIEAEFTDGRVPGPLTISLAYALQGRLHERPYDPANPAWGFVKPFLTQLNERHKP